MLNIDHGCYIFAGMKRLLAPVLLLLVAGTLWAQTTERQLFLEAEGRYQSGDYELALELYNTFLKDYPLSSYVPDVQFRRAVSLFRVGQTAQAIQLLNEIPIRYPQTRFLPYVPFWLGLAEYQLKDYSKAVQAFDQYLSGNDETVRNQALLYKAVSERELGKLDSARLTLVRLMDRVKNPASEPYALAELSVLRLRNNDYQGVLDLLSKVDLSTLPTASQQRLELYKAEAYYGNQDYSSAESIFSKLLDAPPSIASVAFQRLFSIYQATNDQSKLTSIVNKAEITLSGMPQVLTEFWLRVGIDSYKQGKLNLAESYFQRIWGLRTQVKTSPLVPLYLAEIYAKTKRLPKAISILKDALPTATEYQDLLLFRLAGFELQSGDYVGAHKLFQQFLSSYPHSSYRAEAGYLDAYASYELKDYAGSIATIDAQFASARSGAYAAKMLRLKSLAFVRTGQIDKAIEALKEYLPLVKNDLGAQVDLTKLYFQSKDFPSVIRESGEILKDYPDLAKKDVHSDLLVRYMRGLALLTDKKYTEAVAMLKPLTPRELASAGLSVITPYAEFYQGWASYRLADYKGAAALFDQVLSGTAPTDLANRTLYLAGWCAYLRKEYSGAGTYFLKYANAVQGAERQKGQYMYAKSLESGGNLDGAELAFQNIFVDTPKSDFADDALFEYAGVLAVQKKVEAAVAAYKRLATDYPNSPLVPNALYKRAELLYANKKYDQAKAAFTEYRLEFPHGDQVAAALYWGGRASLAAGEDFGAVLLWQKLIDDYKTSTYRADAMQRTANIYSTRGDLRKALKLYNELEAVYPKEAAAVGAADKAQKIQYILTGQSEKEAELLVTIGKNNGAETKTGRSAMVELARIYIYKSGSKQDQAVPLLKQVIAKKSEDPSNAAQAEYLLGEYYYRNGDLSKAANDFLSAATIDPQNRDLTASSLYRAAEMAKLAGNMADAQTMVSRIEKNFPNSEWAIEAKKLLGGAK